MSAPKLWLLYVVAALALSAAATFIVRRVWGAESPWWYFAIAGGIVGTMLSSTFIKAGWRD